MFKYIFTTTYILLLAYGVALSLGTPSNERNWNVEQAVLPSITIEDDLVHIDHIRDFSYTSTTEFAVTYTSSTYAIADVESVWFAVEPFQGFVGAAHTLVSFGFTDGTYLSVSIEIRKEQGESFSPFKGIVNKYEIMYVIATESDVLDLRTNHRKDDVFLYPIDTTKERAQAMFVSMMKRASELETQPEYYHTVLNNCTTNLVDHVNEIVPGRLPWNYSSIFPEYADIYAVRHGLIDAAGDIDTIRAKYKINDSAAVFVDGMNFSTLIR